MIVDIRRSRLHTVPARTTTGQRAGLGQAAAVAAVRAVGGAAGVGAGVGVEAGAGVEGVNYHYRSGRYYLASVAIYCGFPSEVSGHCRVIPTLLSLSS